jgi:hypothetical protein
MPRRTSLYEHNEHAGRRTASNSLMVMDMCPDPHESAATAAGFARPRGLSHAARLSSRRSRQALGARVASSAPWTRLSPSQLSSEALTAAACEHREASDEEIGS